MPLVYTYTKLTTNPIHEQKSNRINISDISKNYSKSISKPVIINGIPNPKEIEFIISENKKKDFEDVCKILDYKILESEDCIILSKHFLQESTFPDISLSESVSTLKDMRFILEKFWDYSVPSSSTSRLLEIFYDTVNTSQKELLDSPKGITFSSLSNNQQNSLSKIIMRSELDDLINAQEILYKTLINIKNSKIVFRNVNIVSIFNNDNGHFLFQFVIKNDNYDIKNYNTGDNLYKLSKNHLTKKISLDKHIQDHFVTVINDNGNTLKNISKFNNYRYEESKSEIILNRKNFLVATSPNNLGISIMNSFPVDVQNFLLSKPLGPPDTQPNLPGIPKSENIISVSVRVQKRLDYVSALIKSQIQDKYMKNEIDFKDLNAVEQKMITDYIFFTGILQSVGQIKKLYLSPSAYLTDPMSCTVKRNSKNSFTVSHPKEFFFTVRSGDVMPR